MTDINTPGNGSKILIAQETEAGDAQSPCAEDAVHTKAAPSKPARRATGPRTPAGKRRSKYNAVKHGIFTRAVLEGLESKQEYYRLLQALREDLQPEGTLEDILVEQLATLFWRRRRVLEAEKGAIQENARFILWDKTMEQVEEVVRTDDRLVPWAGGLLRRRLNPCVLEKCIDILQDWRKGFAESGFDSNEDIEVLARVYGFERLELAREGLPCAYRLLAAITKQNGKAEEGAHLSPTQGKEAMLRHIDEEIKRLTQLKTELTEQQGERLQCQAQTQMVPDSVDRLIRYETMLSREIDKTLSQFERLQRRRHGERDLPPIKIDL